MLLSKHELIAGDFERNLTVASRMVTAHLPDATEQLYWTLGRLITDRAEHGGQLLQQGVLYSGADLKLTRVSDADNLRFRGRVATFRDRVTLEGLDNFDEVPFNSITASRDRTLHEGGFMSTRSFSTYSLGLAVAYGEDEKVTLDARRDPKGGYDYAVYFSNGRSTEHVALQDDMIKVEGRPLLRDINFAARVLRISAENIWFFQPVESCVESPKGEACQVDNDPYPIRDGFAQRLRDGFVRAGRSAVRLAPVTS